MLQRNYGKEIRSSEFGGYSRTWCVCAASYSCHYDFHTFVKPYDTI